MDRDNKCNSIGFFGIVFLLMGALLLSIILMNYTYIGWSTIVVENYGTIKVPSSWNYEINNGIVTLYDRDGNVMAKQLTHIDDVGYCVTVDGMELNLKDGDLQNTAAYSGMSSYEERVYHIDKSMYRLRYVKLGCMLYAVDHWSGVFVLEDACSRRIAKKITRSFMCVSEENMYCIKEALLNQDEDQILKLFSKSVLNSTAVTDDVNRLMEMIPGDSLIGRITSSEINVSYTSVQDATVNYSEYLVGDSYLFVIIDRPDGTALRNDIGMQTVYIMEVGEEPVPSLAELLNLTGIVFGTQGDGFHAPN